MRADRCHRPYAPVSEPRATPRRLAPSSHTNRCWCVACCAVCCVLWLCEVGSLYAVCCVLCAGASTLESRGGVGGPCVCFFKLNRSFHPSTSSTTSVCADSPIPESYNAMSSYFVFSFPPARDYRFFVPFFHFSFIPVCTSLCLC